MITDYNAKWNATWELLFLLSNLGIDAWQEDTTIDRFVTRVDTL